MAIFLREPTLNIPSAMRSVPHSSEIPVSKPAQKLEDIPVDSEDESQAYDEEFHGLPNMKCYNVALEKVGLTKFVIVHILTDSRPIDTCEIRFFSMDNEWCYFPPENSVPNGHLEVSRNKAVLHCNEGFKERDGKRVYATCEKYKWLYRSLWCVEDTTQKNNNILAIVVGSVITTLILIFGLTIFLIRSKKIRGLCATYKPGNRNSQLSSPFFGDSSTTDL
ncbi:hypothetical protein AVEN_219063-1 [Araneus ventricosus]|uniref:Sushi domain-containing protein n=1 Tax=Araneus ventricosus TaxID=182803 RepID=A0A4Y2GA96_ARAVE|nr:hypothetical protein AVEN_219063-1 [Araneus ventricosus]